MTLRLDHLRVGYKRTPLLGPVTETAHPDSITVIVGPNGSGKSTLLKTIAGVIPPLEGVVSLHGTDLKTVTPRARGRLMALVGQRPGLCGAMTARGVVSLAHYAQGTPPSAIDEAMEAVDVVDLAHERFHELSVGQQQRVSVARALAQVPRGGVLLMDEPTAACDPVHVTSVLEAIRSRARGGGTILLVSHDLGVARAWGDAVWVVAGGEVTAGAPDAILSPPAIEDRFGASMEEVTREDGSIWLVPRPSHRDVLG